MRKVKLYIAASLDGKIAKPDDSVAWLESILNPDQTDYGYKDFYNSVDTTIMGNKTYQAIRNFDTPFPYLDKTNYVFTRNTELKNNEYVEFVSREVDSFIQKLKKQEGKDIWLIGGGSFSTFLLNEDLVDELQIFIMPIVIGEGIPLFEGSVREIVFKLEESFAYSNGVQLLRYSIPHLNE